MSNNKTKQTGEGLQEVEHALTSAELFFEKNARIITIVFGAAVGVALLLLATHRFYTIPMGLSFREFPHCSSYAAAKPALCYALY